MRNPIITNNSSVVEKYETVIFIDGSVEDVLIRVRDYVHMGYELISHPLPASLRMMFSPVRSVILGHLMETVDYYSAEVIEDSIIKYRNHMDFRRIDYANEADYKMIDLILFESSFKESGATGNSI